MVTELEEHVTTLQMRLDHATRQLSLVEIHQSSLSAERDRAVKELAEACEKVKILEVQAVTVKKELEQMNQLRADVEVLRIENKSLREDNTALRQDRGSVGKENQSLRTSHRNLTQQHDSLSQDYANVQSELDELHEAFDSLQNKHHNFEKQQNMLRRKNEDLEKHNERFFQENQKLHHENVMYERKNNDLNDKCDRLQQLIDLLEQETHTQTKTIDAVLESKEENALLKRELERIKIELSKSKSDFAKEENKRLEAEVESLRRQGQNAQKTSSDIETENAKLRVEVEGLRLHQNGSASPLGNGLKGQLYEIKDKLTSAEAEIQTLRKEKLALWSKFDSLQTRYEAVSEDNSRAYKQLDQYQAQFLALVKEVQKNAEDAKNPPTKQVTFAEPPNVERIKPKAASESTATGKTSTGRIEEDFTQQFQFVPKDLTIESNHRPALRSSEQTVEKNVEPPPLTYQPTAEDVTDTDLPPRPAIKPGQARTDAVHTHTLPTMSFDLSKGLPLPTAQWSGCVRSSGYAELNIKTRLDRTRTTGTDKSAPEASDDEDESEDEADPADMTTEENMTSAFFMPDITIDKHKKPETAEDEPIGGEEAVEEPKSSTFRVKRPQVSDSHVLERDEMPTQCRQLYFLYTNVPSEDGVTGQQADRRRDASHSRIGPRARLHGRTHDAAVARPGGGSCHCHQVAAGRGRPPAESHYGHA